MANQLSPETVRRIEALFPATDWAEVSKLLLTECGNNLPFLEKQDEIGLERCQFAALKLSEGHIHKLREAVELAKTDWRDLLVAAGFASSLEAHKSWFPDPAGKTPHTNLDP